MSSLASMSSLPRPRHFITRPDGTMTPLIALDEMPDDVRIMNVPVSLTPEQTAGMTSMGMEPKSTGKYAVSMTEQKSVLEESVVVESVAVKNVAAAERMGPPPVPTATKPESVEPATKSSSLSTSKDLRHSRHAVHEEPAASNTSAEPQNVQHSSHSTFTPPAPSEPDNQVAADSTEAESSDVNIIEQSILDWRRTIGTGNAPGNTTTSPPDGSPSPVAIAQTPGQPQPRASMAVGSNHPASTILAGTSSPYNPATAGVFNRKIYCSHWLRTGECDFIQQGCIFQHVMPPLEVLGSLGFRSYPRWFRENLLMDGRPIPPMNGQLIRGPPQQQPFRPPLPAAVYQQPPHQSLTPSLNTIQPRPMYGHPGPQSTYPGNVAQARGVPPPATWNRWPAREERLGPGSNFRAPQSRVTQAVNPWQNRQPGQEAQAPLRRGPSSVASEWNPNLPPQPFDRVIRNAAPRIYQQRDLLTASPSVTESVVSTKPPSPTFSATSHREDRTPHEELVSTQEISRPSTPNPTPRVNLPTMPSRMTILARPDPPATTSMPLPPRVTSTPLPPQPSSLSFAPIPVMATPTSPTAAAAPSPASSQVTAAPSSTSAGTSAPNQVMAAPQTPSLPSTTAAGQPHQMPPSSDPPTAPQTTEAPPRRIAPHPPTRPSRREKSRMYGPHPLPQYPSLRPSAPEFNPRHPAFTPPPRGPTHRPLNDLLPEAPEVKVVRRFTTFVAPDARVLSAAGDTTPRQGTQSGGGRRRGRDPAIIAQGSVKSGEAARSGTLGSSGSPSARGEGERRVSDAESNLMDLSSA